MKKILVLILGILLVVGISVSASDISINIDGNAVDFVAYNIDDNNYFRLRDLASALSETDAPFDVLWNEGVVEITKGTPYSADADTISNDKNPEIVVSNIPVYCNGKRISAKAYNIGGNTFFKLRDIAKVIDFGVNWSQSQGIIIDTSRTYALTAEEERKLYIEYANRRHQEFVAQNEGWWEDMDYYSFGDVDRDGKDELLVKKSAGITIYKAIDGEVKRMYCDPLPESTGEYQYHHVICDGKDCIAYIKDSEIRLYILDGDSLTQIEETDTFEYAKRYTLEEITKK